MHDKSLLELQEGATSEGFLLQRGWQQLRENRTVACSVRKHPF